MHQRHHQRGFRVAAQLQQRLDDLGQVRHAPVLVAPLAVHDVQDIGQAIVESRPYDWWTGEPVSGDYIVQSEFLKDLEVVSGAKTLTIRMDSVGGNAGVAILIHNRLRELATNGTALTSIIDGVAMSGGSLIICACDTVEVNPSSLIMIHKCWGRLRGDYNADELRKQAAEFDAWDKAQVSIYKRKSGLDDATILGMMAETTYMTGAEAVEKGFADKLLEDAEPLEIAASADRRRLFVRGRQVSLAPGLLAPQGIPTAAATMDKDNLPAQIGQQNGGKTMANTPDELRKENPALAEQLMAEAQAAVSGAAASPTASPDPAPASPGPAQASGEQPPDPVSAERQRIREIDALAGLFDTETISAAKYGDTACTAQEMVYQAAQKASRQGRKFLAALEADTAASGAQEVGAADSGAGKSPGAEGDTPQAMAAQAKADVAAFQKMREVR